MKLTKPLFLFAVIACTISSWAQWQLNENSDVNFTTVKKGTVVESHRFHGVSGSVSDSGKASISISLASVDTGIQIRDTRMQEMLFEIVQFPEAVITADVDVKSLKPGTSEIQQVLLTIDLHGIKKQVTAWLRVTQHGADQVSVSSVKSIVIRAEDFALTAGIEKLRKVAALDSITSAVAVNVNLWFNR